MIKYNQLFLMIILSLSASIAQAYSINNCHSLMNLYLNPSSKYMQLIGDIDCRDEKYDSIPELPAGYTLDGKNYTVSNLRIIPKDGQRDQDIGLFAAVDGGTVQNINFENITVKSRDDFNRGLIAGSANTGTFSNINVNGLTFDRLGDHKKIATSGGLIGKAKNISLSNISISNAHIKPSQHNGGLIGYLESDSGHGAHTFSNITIQNLNIPRGDHDSITIGGLIGRSDSILFLDNVHLNNGNIGNNEFNGGLIGLVKDSTSIVHSSVTSLYVNEAGEECKFDNCFLGGFIGKINPTDHIKPTQIDIKTSFVKGGKVNMVNGGGFIGEGANNNTESENITIKIEDSYTNIPMEGKGGIVASLRNEEFILNRVYAAGLLTSNTSKGGIVGEIGMRGIAGEEIYFDTESMDTTAYSSSCPTCTSDNIKGLDTEQMKTVFTFSEEKGWSRKIWDIEDGKYPTLKESVTSQDVW